MPKGTPPTHFKLENKAVREWDKEGTNIWRVRFSQRHRGFLIKKDGDIYKCNCCYYRKNTCPHIRFLKTVLGVKV